MFIKKVHVFRAGPQISAQGIERNFTPDDLQEVVDSYDSKVHEAPLVIGHSGDNDSTPAYGWIKDFSRDGENLYANVAFTDTAKDLVKKGHYKKVSISFYSPESPINPHKGKWSARHLAMLGAAPPAVKGLESLSFSESGLFDFAVGLSPDELFDKDLGPTMIIDRSPLEMLKERLDEVKDQINDSLKQLEENQKEQTESQTSETTPSAEENATPNNPSQQFNEMNKNLGREGAETVESADDLKGEGEVTTKKKKMKASQPSMSPEGEDMGGEFKEKASKKRAMGEEEMVMGEGEEEEEFGEGVRRKSTSGANGQKVQVVEEVYKESKKKKAPAMEAEEEEMEMEDEEGDEMEAEEEEMEFDEVSDKSVKGGKVTFGTHTGPEGEKVTGRSKTARSDSDSYAKRQNVGEGDEEDRDSTAKDSSQDKDRDNTAKSSAQDEDRDNLAKSDEGDDSEDSRWAGQSDARKKVMNNDQYDDDDSDYPETQKAEESKGTDPHGRTGGPTKVSSQSEEDPDDMEMAVDLENVKGSKNARVLYNSAGQKRAAVKGGAIADHAEGGDDGEPDEEGRVASPKKAKTSSGNDARGRSGGTTKFPTKSEEEPDDMEMAVNLEDATSSNKVRVVRQKAGDKASVNHAESRKGKKSPCKDPMTLTGKGSTYEENMDGEDSEEFCGADMKYGDMGSMGQAKPLGVAEQIYEELKAVREENARLKREFEEQQVRGRKQRIAHFIENLYGEGKLTDAVIPQGELQSYCEGLEFGTLEFSEGESPSTKLLGLLSRLPNMVYFNEVVSSEKFEPEEEELDPHERALQMVKRGEASDYLEAIKMAIPWSSRG